MIYLCKTHRLDSIIEGIHAESQAETVCTNHEGMYLPALFPDCLYLTGLYNTVLHAWRTIFSMVGVTSSISE